MTSVATYIKAEFINLTPREILLSPIDVLIGVSADVATTLHVLDIRNVFDLATSRVFNAAREIAAAEVGANTLFAKHGSVPSDFIDNDQRFNDLAKMGAADIETLEGIGSKNREQIFAAINLSSIRDLSLWQPFLSARSILSSVYGGGEAQPNDETPEELLPRARRYATETLSYEKIFLEEIDETGYGISLSEAGPLDISSRGFEGGFTSPAYGALLTFTQEWIPEGLSLGHLLYSLALAPGEVTKVAVIDWARQTEAALRESTTESERMKYIASQSRAIEEIHNGVISELQEGEATTNTNAQSNSSGIAAGAILGSIGLGGSGGVSNSSGNTRTISSSRGRREISAEMLQRIDMHTQQQATATRTRRAAVVKETEQSEREELKTRVVANYNHSHALTIQYYEVVQQYRVRTRLGNTERCIFIPMKLIDFQNPNLLNRYRSILLDVALSPKHRELLEASSDLIRVSLEAQHASQNNFELAKRIAFDVYLDSNGGKAVNYGADDYAREHGDKVNASYYELQTKAKEAARREEARLNRFGISGNSLDQLYRIPKTTEIIWVTQSYPNPIKSFTFYLRDGARAIEEQFTSTDVYVGQEIGPFQINDLERVDIKLAPLTRNATFDVTFRLRQGAETFELTLPILVEKNVSSLTLISFSPTAAQFAAARALNEDALYYSQRIYERLDQGTLAMILAPLTFDGGKRLVEYIDTTPLGTYGNYLIFRLHNQTKNWRVWLEGHTATKSSAEQIIPVATNGVFAEAVLGRSNASEKIDLTRFWDWQDSPIPHLGPEISALQAGTRGTAENLQTGQLSAPIVNIQNPQPLPDPTGLSAIMGSLSSSNIFRDMSGLTGNLALTGKGIDATSQGASDAMHAASANLNTMAALEAEKMKLARDMLSAYMGIPSGSAGKSSFTGGMINHGQKLDRDKMQSVGADTDTPINRTPVSGSTATKGSDANSPGGSAASNNEQLAFERALGGVNRALADAQSSTSGGSGASTVKPSRKGEIDPEAPFFLTRTVEAGEVYEYVLLNFPVSESELQPKHTAGINAIMNKLNSDPDFVIQGFSSYTSKTGGDNSNKNLAKERMAAIELALDLRGLPASKYPFRTDYTFESVGESRSLADYLVSAGYSDVPEISQREEENGFDRGIVITVRKGINWETKKTNKWQIRFKYPDTTGVDIQARGVKDILKGLLQRGEVEFQAYGIYEQKGEQINGPLLEGKLRGRLLFAITFNVDANFYSSWQTLNLDLAQMPSSKSAWQDASMSFYGGDILTLFQLIHDPAPKDSVAFKEISRLKDIIGTGKFVVQLHNYMKQEKIFDWAKGASAHGFIAALHTPALSRASVKSLLDWFTSFLRSGDEFTASKLKDILQAIDKFPGVDISDEFINSIEKLPAEIEAAIQDAMKLIELDRALELNVRISSVSNAPSPDPRVEWVQAERKNGVTP